MRTPLTRYRLQKMVNTREADMLEAEPPPTLKQLEDYAEGTATQLLQLQVPPTMELCRFRCCGSSSSATAEACFL